MLDRRPLVAGMLFGLLAYKPQFGLMIPLALAAGGRWRRFAAAAATVALCWRWRPRSLSGRMFGRRFSTPPSFTRTVVLEQGDTGWHKIQSIFAWARMWGAPIPLAYALQGAVTVALGVRARSGCGAAPRPIRSRRGALPRHHPRDALQLRLRHDGAGAGHRLLRRRRPRPRFRPWEKTALAALWLVPLVARSVAQLTLIPLGVPAMLAVFILLLRRSTISLRLADGFSGTFLLK